MSLSFLTHLIFINFNNLILIFQNTLHSNLNRVKGEITNFAFGGIRTHDFCIRGKRRPADNNLKLFQYLSRCCSIVKPLWSSGKTLAANAGGSGVRIPPRAEFVFHFYNT